jgi:hypothetical protein
MIHLSEFTLEQVPLYLYGDSNNYCFGTDVIKYPIYNSVKHLLMVRHHRIVTQIITSSLYYRILFWINSGNLNYHASSYPVSTGDKAAGPWSWPLTSIYFRGQEWWIYTSTPPYIFMARCLINSAREQLYLFLPFIFIQEISLNIQGTFLL